MAGEEDITVTLPKERYDKLLDIERLYNEIIEVGVESILDEVILANKRAAENVLSQYKYQRPENLSEIKKMLTEKSYGLNLLITNKFRSFLERKFKP